MKKIIIIVVTIITILSPSFSGQVIASISKTLLKNFGSRINAIYVEGTNILVGTDDGLYVSQDNGKTFVAKNEGLTYTKVSDIDFIMGRFYIGTDGGGLYSGLLTDRAWTSEKSRVDCPTIASISSDQLNIYITSRCSGFLASFDGGKTYTAVNKGLDSIETTAFLKVNQSLYYLGSANGLYYSTSIGPSTSWKKILPDCQVTSLSYANGIVFVGTSTGLFSGKENIFYKKQILGGNPYISFTNAYDNKLILSINGFGFFATVDGEQFCRIKSEDFAFSTTSNVNSEKKSMLVGDSSGKLYRVDLSKTSLAIPEKLDLGEVQKGRTLQGSFWIINLGFNSFSASISGPSFITFSPKTVTSTSLVKFIISTSSLSTQNYSLPIKVKSDAGEETLYITFSVSKYQPTVIKLWIGSTKATISGESFTLDAAPFIDASSSRTLVPVRFISEALRSEVLWDSKTKKVTIANKELEKTIALWVGSKTAKVNGDNYALDVAPVIMPPGRTFVPLRFISEAFGAEVQWDSTKKEITITL